MENQRNAGETSCNFVYDDICVCIYIYILQHINQNNILATEQYGFRNNSSTEKACFQLVNEILLAINN